LEALPYQQWTFVIVVYVFGPTRNTIVVAQNGAQKGLLTFPSLGTEVNFARVSLTLGGGDVERVPLPAKLAIAGFYPMSSKADVIGLFGLGLRGARTVSFPYFKYFYDYGELNSGKFIDIFGQQSGIDAFLPILTLKHYKFRNGDIFEPNLPLIFTILVSLLNSSVHAQDAFQQSSGFSVISYLLIENWVDQFTLKMYQTFVNLFESLYSEDLQEQLFTHLLTHYRFMMAFDGDLHLRIVQTWPKALFSQCHSMAHRVWGPKEILALLRTFYWFKPRDTIVAQMRKHPLNVSSCRTQFMKILFSYFSEGFTEDDYLAVVNHCIGSEEVKQGEELLLLIIQIVDEIPEMIRFKLEGPPLLSLVYYHLTFPVPSLQELSLELLVVCHIRKLISDRFFAIQMQAIVSIFPKSAQTREMYGVVQRLFEKDLLVYPLLISLMLKFGIEEIDGFVAALTPSADFVVHAFWAVPFFLLTPHCSTLEVLFLFLLSCDPNRRFGQLYIQADLIFQRYPHFATFVKDHFVRIFCRIIARDKQPSLVVSLFEVSKRVIFYDQMPCPSLVERIADPESLCTQSTMEEVDPASLYEPKFVRPQFAMTLQVDESLSWSHINLAAFCICQLDKLADKPEYLAFAVILGSYLQRVGREWDIDRLAAVLQSIGGVDDGLLQLFHYHSTIAGQRSLFEFPMINPPLVKKRHYRTFLSAVLPERYWRMVDDVMPKLQSFAESVTTTAASSRKIDISEMVTRGTDDVAELLDREKGIQSDC
jgi:hypothetical protein